MKVQIRDRFTAEIIYETEANSLKQAVEQAVKDGASLDGAN